ncbi:MAG: InlB B-repeat-containing protein [Lachnospiraceae bacterium]|nr:InlB B-repeat-containing protein [Lachnospiraceae bacterium]MCM1230880.1 InlB B-repeat-containing protein [Ruminococcus flavefaciens]
MRAGLHNIQLWDINESAAQKFTIEKLSDTTAPQIKDVKISDITKDGYKVTITVTDDIGVKKVAVPTWTQYNSQDDLFNNWPDTALATQTGDNTWTYKVKVSDHNNERGVYYTDVYAWDFNGNEGAWRGENSKRTTVKVGMYNLTVNPNGGTAVNESGTKTTNAFKVTKNQLIYLGANFNSMTWANPSRTGYTFIGWYTSATGGTKVHGADGKCVNDGAYFKNGNYQKASDLTLYAQWQANKYTVTLNADGGTCDKKSISVTYDSKYGILPIPTLEGYNFTGWFDENNNKITADTNVSITEDKVLTAKWEAYNIKGDVNNDKTLNIADAVMLQNWLLGSGTLTSWENADLCKDGKIDIFDMIEIRKLIVQDNS